MLPLHSFSPTLADTPLINHSLSLMADLQHKSWSDLPIELLILIFQNIKYIFELQLCLGVCLSWQSAAKIVVGQLQNTPLLLLPSDNDRSHHKLCSNLGEGKRLFDFADKYRGKYDSSITVAQKYYRSVSGYADELLWGAAWLYKATNNQYYLNYLGNNGDASPSTAMLSEVARTLKITIVGGSVPERCGDNYIIRVVFLTLGEMLIAHR